MKEVSPQNIEGLLTAEPIISQIVVVGDKQRFITALIVPNFEQLKSIFRSEKIEMNSSAQDLVQDPRVHQLFRKRIDERTKDLAPYEKIKYFTLFAKEFSQNAGELTTTLKMKRNVIADHFKDAIQRMYQETESANEGNDRLFFVL